MRTESLVGLVPPGWDVMTLGEACAGEDSGVQTGPFGSQLHASDYVNEGIPTVMPQNIGDNRIIEEGIARIRSEDAERLSRYRLRRGDIVYSRRGDVERRALVRKAEDGWLCGTGSLRVRFAPGVVDSRYASYYLGHPNVRRWVVSHAVGATMPNLNSSILESIPFVVPPLPDQKGIAAILGALDDKIELNRRMNGRLDGIARAIFKSWFVDFDPVHAKMEGREPYGLDGDIAALFPDSLSDSEVGDVPMGWRPQSLSGLARVNAWTLTAKDELNPIQYVDISSVSRGEVSEIATFERGSEPSRARRRPAHGDTVLSTVRPDRGSYFLCMYPPGNLIVSTGFATITPLRVPWAFLHAAITRDDVFEHLGHMADGAAYPAVRPSVIEDLQVVVPDRPKLLDAYHQLCEPMFSHAAANRQESKAIASLRDSLLPKLISGEIRIEDAEKTAEATLNAVS